jgi:hypothetical protein
VIWLVVGCSYSGDNMALPENNEPLRLADGRLVYPNGRVVNGVNVEAPVDTQRFVEVPTHREAQQMIASTRRKISDLPEVPRAMNAIGVILSYTMFGLDDGEIAIATGLPIAQIGKIKMSDPYTQMYDAIVRTVLDNETDVVRELLAKNAKSAAMVMVEALDAGTRSDRMAAAKDILDRSGHRPSDVVEHRHRVDGGLVIEIVRRDGSNVPPTIDMGV